METPEWPPAQPNSDARPEASPATHLITAVAATAISTVLTVNTISIVHNYGWKLEAASIVGSGLLALGAAAIAIHEWVKFYRARDAEHNEQS